jgi:hypothetical protein
VPRHGYCANRADQAALSRRRAFIGNYISGTVSTGVGGAITLERYSVTAVFDRVAFTGNHARTDGGANHELRVSYLGLDDQTVPVQVGPEERVTSNIALTSEVYLLESFVVTGERTFNPNPAEPEPFGLSS